MYTIIYNVYYNLPVRRLEAFAFCVVTVKDEPKLRFKRKLSG